MVSEEVLKTFTGDKFLFNTYWTKEIPAMSFISSLVTNKVQPHLFSNYTPPPCLPSSTTPPSPSGKPSWAAVQLLDISLELLSQGAPT